MADKNFGVKQINLIGASGVPTIQSPNNLNIIATQVAISTDVSVGGQLLSNVKVGSGYSVGIGTTIVRESLDVVGNIRFTGNLLQNGNPFSSGTNYWYQGASGISTTSNVGIGTGASISETLNVLGDVVVNGSMQASSFVGDGSGLTNLPGGGGGIAGINTSGTSTFNNLNVTGVSTFNNAINLIGNLKVATDGIIKIGNSDQLELYYNGGTGQVIKSTGDLRILTNRLLLNNSANDEQLIEANQNGSVALYYDNSKKFETLGTGVTVTGTTFTNQLSISGNTNSAGIITATSFRTNATTGNGTDVGFAIKYYITESSGAYRLAGPGVLNSTNNPTLYLHRGFTYIFENSTTTSHPFAIRTSSGGSAYTSAFLSGSQSGTQIFTVPFDAPNTLVYQCTIHAGMVGTFNIVT